MNVLKRLAVSAAILVCSDQVNAFSAMKGLSSIAFSAAPGRKQANQQGTCSRVILFMDSKEKALREEIASRNSIIADEKQYAVADGADLERTDSVESSEEGATKTTVTVEEDRKSMKYKMERAMKPRAYPLFLAEKAAEFVEMSLDDITKSFNAAPTVSGNAEKERIVILGSGWGAASLLKEIDTNLYDVTVISPRNYFMFTPMLAGSAVGTVDYRSICEPIREINREATFLEATANNVDVKTNTVTCESVVCAGNSCEIDEFDVKFDRLVVTVGAQTNTFGIPGVREHCNFLKQIEDARRVRTAIVNCFERAGLPNITDEDRKRNLTFAVIGAGPTGIEFAAELRDFIEQDGPKYYPDLLRHVRIKVIEASDKVLAPFDKTLQEEAIRVMERAPEIKDPDVANLLPERFKLTELMLEASVKEVTKDKILLNDGREVFYGLSVWAAGNGPLPITLSIIDSLGEEQKALQDIGRGRIAIDPWMRAVGGEGRILAFGDCSCIVSGPLPATAQVASQQGEYLAGILNKKFDLSPARASDGVFPPPMRDPSKTSTTFSDAIASFATNSDEFAKPFQFLNLGILAYTGGNSALAQVTPVPEAQPIKGTGKLGNAVWRSVYLSKQISWRNRLLVMNDWTKRQIFGRDITRL